MSGSLFLAVLCILGSAVDEPGALLQQAFVWTPSTSSEKDVYVVFRKSFELDKAPRSAAIRIFADSRYTLWLNGQYVDRGPCRFDPQAPEYDTLDAGPHLRKGPNALAVLVHHCHDGLSVDDPTPMNGRIMRHVPGLALDLEWTGNDGSSHHIRTDNTWCASARTRFLPSPLGWGGIPDNIDARLDTGDWTQVEFDDTSWEKAAPVDGTQWGSLRPRAIPPLREMRISPTEILKMPGETAVASRPFASSLPIILGEKQEVLINVGRAVLAYDVLDLEAEAGATIEVVHGHGLKNGELDEVYTTNRYITRAGRQTYTSGDTTGFHYLIVRTISGRVTLYGLSVVNRVYPFEREGSFACNDAFLNELWNRSINTIELCSEDGYTDCTARERVEWMGDSALCEYPITRVVFARSRPDGTTEYADSRLARNMLWHIALSQQPDGRLKAHHPSNRWDIHGYIDDYACLWVQMLREYYDATGNDGFVRDVWAMLKKQMQWFLDRRTSRGLVKGREFVFSDNPLSYKECEGTTLNAYVVGALRNAAILSKAAGDERSGEQYKKEADELSESLNSCLWDSEKKTYIAGLLDGKEVEPSVHAAMLALYYDVVPTDRREDVFSWLLGHRAQIGSPYSHAFLFEVLYRPDRDDLDRLALQIMREQWASTLARKDLDTVFEGFGGGSLCHNIGAVPAYSLSARVLGVRRDEPVENRHILVEPRLGDLTTAKGTVVTEFGPVNAEWTRDPATNAIEFRLSIPNDTRTTLALPLPGAKAALVLDGKTVEDGRLTAEGRRLSIELAPGAHNGSISPKP